MSEAPADPARWQRLSALFDELAELDLAACEARLADMRTTDPALADELERLLKADRQAAPTLDSDWRSAMAQTSLFEPGSAALQPEPADRSGERIDEYRLIRRVGRGGMGEVYLAERAGAAFEQRVALKLLRRGVDTEDVVRRFVQERSILARLEHSGIARLIDGGVGGEGLPYLVMEYVEGQPVTAYARQQDLDVDARLRLLIAICEAVDFAHRRLIVHRDLKPSNVLVAADGSVKLLDFGIAKLLDAEAGEENLTSTGMHVLSPAYAAPEQFLGEPIGTATDVYALGVLLFELLTGELPHQRNSRSFDVLAQNVTQEKVEKPSSVLHRQPLTETSRRARRLEGDLDTIVLTALKREPERRYGSAAALAQDLRAFLDGLPIAARPDTFGYRAGKFVRRNQLAVGSAVLVLVAILAGLGIALWQTGIAREQARRADQEARRASLQASRAEQQALVAERTRQFVVALFTDTSPLRARDGKQLTTEGLIKDGLARLENELEDAPAARAELRVVLAQALGGLGDYATSVAPLEKAASELRALHGPSSKPLAHALSALSVAHMRTSDLEAAGLTAEQALQMFESLPEDLREEKIQVRTLLGNLAMRGGDLERALSIHLSNLADRRALFGPDAVELAADYNNLSVAYLGLDRAREAEQSARRALELLQRDPDSPRSRQAWVLAGISSSLYLQGRYEETLESVEAQRSLTMETLPEGHPMQANWMSARARASTALKRYAEADEWFEKSSRIFATTQDHSLGINDVNWGYSLLDQQRNVEAEAKLADAVAHLTAAHGADVPYTLKARVGHGLASGRLRRIEQGLAEAAAAIAIFERRGLDSGSKFGEAALAYAELQRLAKRPDEAARWTTRGIDALERALGPGHPKVRELRGGV